MIQILPMVSPSICHLQMKTSGKKKGKLEVLISCPLIQFHKYLLGNFYAPEIGNMEKLKERCLLEVDMLMGKKIITNNDCTTPLGPQEQNFRGLIAGGHFWARCTFVPPSWHPADTVGFFHGRPRPVCP